MFAVVKSGTVLGCLFLLTRNVFVYSKLAPPCMSQLGLGYNVSLNSLTFHLDVFDGEADNVRLNSPQAWTPLNMNESFLQINISQPVLLTALQVQGDPQLTGRVTGWLLETSLDCDNYHSENYSIDSERLHDTETVLMHKIEFVTCIRLKPTQYTGQTPALRLELLGCAVYDNSRCCPGVQPAKELWIDDGGCQVNYEHEVVLSWVKVLLQPQTASEDNITVASSLSCQQWNYLDTTNMNVVSVTAADQRSRWVTLEFQTPVRARCLRVFPPAAATLAEVHTSECGSRLTSSLVELVADTTPPSKHRVEEIATFATTNISSGETTAASPTTTLETLEVQTPEEYASTRKPNETSVTMVQCILTNSDSNNNESQADLTQYSNDTKNSKSNNGFQANTTQYSNDTTNSNISTNSLWLDTPAPTENISTTVASTEKTTTTETLPSTNISSGASLNVTNIGDTSTHQTTSNDSMSFNITAIEQHENADRNRTTTESTSTQFVLSDLFTNITITPTVQGQSSDKPPANESKPETSKSKGTTEAECGVKTTAQRIRRKRVISGHVNSPGEWPWLVSLHYLIEFDFTRMSGFKHTCGATLVAPGWVITAAHCFADDLLKGLSNLTCWRVYLGMHDLAKASSDHFVQERLIDAVYTFPSYNITKEPLLYDLALVKLNEAVEINERSSPICLDDHTDLHDEDSLCYVSGWGQTTLSTPGSRYPHTAAMSTMTLARCKEMYDKLGNHHDIKQYARIEPPVLCAAVGSDGQDACQGDSGGPLMCERHGRWYQAGIVAGGYLCGHQATPGLYTRISYYSKWIVETMGLHND